MSSTFSRIMSAGLAILLVMLFAVMHLAAEQPWLGFQAAPGAEGVVVQRVQARGPSAGLLKAGDVLLALSNEQDTLALEAWDAVAEPDDAATLTEYLRFFERQQQVWHMLQQGPLQLTLKRQADTIELTLQPQPKRGLAQQTPLFWYQLVCASLILLMGVAAVAFAHKEIGARMYALAGLAISIAILSSAIYTTRELVMSGELMHLLSRINQAGAMLFAAFGTAMLWYYPTRLGRLNAGLLFFCTAVLILVINYSQWLDSLDAIVRAPLLVWLVVDLALAVAQWRNTRGDPIQRARLKWLLYAWFAGVVGYLILVITPQLVGYPSVLAQPYAWGLFVLTYLGIALGIVRYRLFDLDRWVLHAWFWFFCGVSIVAFDALLVLWLRIETSLSLFITVALAGWLYFPLRQWFLSHLLPRPLQQQDKLMARTVTQAFQRHGSQQLETAWPRALREIFQPLSITTAEQALTASELSQNGLQLHVPALDGQQALVLSHASRGHRLFNRSDQATADQAYQLFSYACEFQHGHQQGVQEERERLAADLHDEVGSRLLQIVYRSSDEHTANLARDTLQALRVAMQDLQQGRASLVQVIRHWLREHQEPCQHKNVQLNIQLDEDLKPREISATARSQLTRMVRELITNTLRHAQAKQIQIQLHTTGSILTLDYQDDGIGLPDNALVQDGMGLRNLMQRCHSLGGDMTQPSPQHWRFRLPILNEASA